MLQLFNKKWSKKRWRINLAGTFYWNYISGIPTRDNPGVLQLWTLMGKFIHWKNCINSFPWEILGNFSFSRKVKVNIWHSIKRAWNPKPRKKCLQKFELLCDEGKLLNLNIWSRYPLYAEHFKIVGSILYPTVKVIHVGYEYQEGMKLIRRSVEDANP